jgi:L-asparaginase
MRNHPGGSRRPANILAAVQTAASPETRGLGVVVFADEIHAAPRCGKTHSTSGHTFVSANSGPLG